MTCLLHEDPDGPGEYFCHPFMACPEIGFGEDGRLHCPCPGGCPGEMRADGFNSDHSLEFYVCLECGDAAVVRTTKNRV